jgi:hypothetical protein
MEQHTKSKLDVERYYGKNADNAIEELKKQGKP